MKDQYFGDINDFRKYGLLRYIARELKIGICWMLTESDARRDGGRIAYLSQRQSPLCRLDQPLYQALHNIVIGQRVRRVAEARLAKLIPGATYFESPLDPRPDERKGYFEAMREQFASRDVVFFDPDNGMEVPSCRYGRSRSEKYVYYDELRHTYDSGKSIVVYQHFPRIERQEYLQQRSLALVRRTGTSRVVSLSTSFVAFFVLIQKKHVLMVDLLREFQKDWASEFSFLQHK